MPRYGSSSAIRRDASVRTYISVGIEKKVGRVLLADWHYASFYLSFFRVPPSPTLPSLALRVFVVLEKIF